jgi:hypothetical protein
VILATVAKLLSNIFTLQEELPGLLATYERRGHFDEVLSLLEAGLSLERAHVGISNIVYLLSLMFLFRWVSSLNSRYCIANTDLENVSGWFYCSARLTFLCSDGTPQALCRPHQHSKGE